MSSDNGMTKDKESYYVNYEIASIFRDDMLLICVKRQHTCPGSPRKFLTKYSSGEKEAGGRTERSGRKNKKEKKTFAIFTKKGECFFDFLAFAKFLSSIWLVITPELLHEML